MDPTHAHRLRRRRTRLFGAGLLVTVAVGCAAVPAGATTPVATAPAGLAAPHQVASHLPHLARSHQSFISSNTSGEEVTSPNSGSYSLIQGDWTVPSITASASDRYSATWIGINGDSETQLLQAGTAQREVGGTISYFAWVSQVPNTETPLSAAPVSPGDAIQSYLQETGSGTWEISLADSTQGWTFQQSVTYDGPASNAEWIEEAPRIHGTVVSTLADFGATTFTNMAYTGPSGSTLNPVYMSNNAETKFLAWPGPYNGSTHSFTVHYGTPPPVITSVSPDSGSTAGGTRVTISGYFLYATTGVTFGGRHASFTVNADGTVTAVSPSSGSGTVDIGVVSTGGTTTPSPADHFTYAGYDLVGSDGGVFVFGGGFHGSLPGIGVHVDDVTGIVPTTTDDGYFLVGSDGGVFAFNAPFANSLPGIGVHVNDIVGIAATPDDQGYWVLGSDGSVYGFGDATKVGNAAPGAAGITATKDGKGYWVVGRNGSVQAFGDAGNFGDLPGLGVSVDDIVAIVVSADGGGYNLFGSDGGVFTFGDATNIGSLPGLGVHVDDVVGAVPT